MVVGGAQGPRGGPARLARLHGRASPPHPRYAPQAEGYVADLGGGDPAAADDAADLPATLGFLRHLAGSGLAAAQRPGAHPQGGGDLGVLL